MALCLTDDVTARISLRARSRWTLGPHDAEVLKLTLSAGEQSGDGEALLQISSAELGTRWRLPVRAEQGSLAGLWVGEVVVNDVSEGRLGATDVEGGLLTIALRPREGSGITGKAELQEKISGNTSSVAVTLTLALPASEIITPTVRTGTGLYLRGYVFADTNQNGERDGAEAGFAGRTVTLTLPGGVDDGRRRRGAMGGTCSRGWTPGIIHWRWTRTADGLHRRLHGHAAGHRDRPADASAGAQCLARIGDPGRRRGDAGGLPAIHRGTITGPNFPHYDATDQRVEPTLNFGYVSAYDAFLWTGVCNDRRRKAA